MKNRIGGLVALLIAAVILGVLYGPLAVALVAVAGGATFVASCYPPLPTSSLRARLPQLRWSEDRSELRRRRADLEWALRDGHQADQALRPGLARTADALLRGRTDRGLDDDPALTRGLLGPELSDYLSSRRGVPPTAAQLDGMLHRLEGLQ